MTASEDELLKELRAIRSEFQNFPERIVKALRQEVITACVVIGALVLLGDLGRWIYHSFLK